MLVKNWNSPTKATYFNNNNLADAETQKIKFKTYKNLLYPTQNPEHEFENILLTDLNNLILEQQESIKKEADIFLKYNLITKANHNKTIDIYSNFFYYKKLFYSITELRDFVRRDQIESNTNTDTDSIYTPSPLNPPTFHHNEEATTPNTPLLNHNTNTQPKKYIPTYTISRQAIRDITGYTNKPIPTWSYKAPYNTPEYHKPMEIKWQLEVLEDQADTIVINASRQVGKSEIMAERAIEESFIPENDMLVGAFLAKTTNVIRNKILKGIRKFKDGDFVHKKSEGYILNTISNTKIYFRTLADGAANVLGLTLYTIIIDESQLVDEEVFEDALLPTLTTTGGRLVMIGTPGRSMKGYYFNKIMEAKKQKEDPSISPYERISLYDVDITMNPLVHPRVRKRIMAKKHEPAIQRQYFCSWTADSDRLFKPKIINFIPTTLFQTLNQKYTLVLALDPARLADRSGYSLSVIYDGKLITLLSGEVPKAYKKKWTLQATFYKKLIEKYKATPPTPNIPSFNNQSKNNNDKFITIMDVTGVGDGVAEIFDANGVKINIKVRYTSGQAQDTANYPNWKIPKSTLINNTLDFILEDVLEVFQPANKDLLEEMDYIYEDETRTGLTAMTSTFYDDITNTVLLAVTATKEKGLLNRSQKEDNLTDPNNPLNTVEGYFTGLEGTDEEKNALARKYQLQRNANKSNLW